MQISLFIKLRGNKILTVAAAAAGVFAASQVAADCISENFVSDDSISVSVTATEESGKEAELSWLLDQGIEQLLHKQLVVVSNSEPRGNKEHQECPLSAFRLIGGVHESGSIARVTFQLIDTAHSDVRWTESFDRQVGGDIKAISDELASLTALEVIKIVSGQID